MLRKINLGLIGLGYIGKIHLKNGLKLKNANLLAVSDISKMALSEARKAGVKNTFSDYRQLLQDARIDAVIIALPNHLHLECAKLAAEGGTHILIEKPIATSVVDANEIVSAARRNSLRLMVGYPLRFNKVMYALRHRINSGELGDIVTAYATNIATGPFMHRARGHIPLRVPEWWFAKQLTGGGALMDLGSHMINLSRWYFGEISEIESYLGYRYNLDVEDHSVCIARFESGTTAVINVGWTSQDYQLKVDVHGTVKNAKAENLYSRVRVVAQTLLTNNSPVWEPHLCELQHFVNCIIKDKQPHPSGIDGLRDVQAIERAYRNSSILNHPK